MLCTFLMACMEVTELLSAVRSTPCRSDDDAPDPEDVGECWADDAPAPDEAPAAAEPPAAGLRPAMGDGCEPSADRGRVLLVSLRDSSFFTAWGLAAPRKGERKRKV